jgi:hypothetical protein
MCRNGWMKRLQRLMIPVASRGHGFHIVALGQCRITTCGVSSRCLCWPGHLVGGGPSVPVALSYAEELVKALPTDAAAHFEAARLYARAAHKATGERGMEWRGEALGFLRSARDLSAEVKGGWNRIGHSTPCGGTRGSHADGEGLRRLLCAVFGRMSHGGVEAKTQRRKRTHLRVWASRAQVRLRSNVAGWPRRPRGCSAPSAGGIARTAGPDDEWHGATGVCG